MLTETKINLPLTNRAVLLKKTLINQVLLYVNSSLKSISEDYQKTNAFRLNDQQLEPMEFCLFVLESFILLILL